MMSTPSLVKKSTFSEIRRVFLVTLWVNLTVALSKLGWGLWTDTLSMTADGFHSLLDATSNVVGIIGLNIAAKPPDVNHPYGHRKFEALAAMLISFFIFSTCLQIIREAFGHLINPEAHHPSVNWISYTVMLVTLGLNILITRYERRQGEALKSQLLLADAAHTQSDVYATVAVLASLVCIQLGIAWADTAIALGLALLIFKAGYSIIRTHMGDLVDEAIIPPEQLEPVVLATPGVISCHRIRSRGMADHVFVDLHIQVNPHLSLREAHVISHRVEEAIRQQFPQIQDVLVHTEEEGDQDELLPS